MGIDGSNCNNKTADEATKTDVHSSSELRPKWLKGKGDHGGYGVETPLRRLRAGCSPG